jgi:hypothetical protein
MKRIRFLCLCAFTLSLVISCRDEEDAGIPTVAPVATVPPLATLTPIPPTATPAPLDPRFVEENLRTFRPSIEIVSTSQDVASAQNPAIIQLEIVTLSPISVTLEIIREEDDGRLTLIGRQPLSDGDFQDEQDPHFEAGIHDQLAIWYPSGYYLSDGTAGDYVLLRS